MWSMDETAGARPHEEPEESAEPVEKGEDSREEEIPLPPPTFEYLVFSLRLQAETSLGLLHFGGEKERPTPSLPLARHSIDLLAMLLEKTKGNLTLEESRQLENAVTELRFRYVQAAEGGTKK